MFVVYTDLERPVCVILLSFGHISVIFGIHCFSLRHQCGYVGDISIIVGSVVCLKLNSSFFAWCQRVVPLSVCLSWVCVDRQTGVSAKSRNALVNSVCTNRSFVSESEVQNLLQVVKGVAFECSVKVCVSDVTVSLPCLAYGNPRRRKRLGQLRCPGPRIRLVLD